MGKGRHTWKKEPRLQGSPPTPHSSVLPPAAQPQEALGGGGWSGSLGSVPAAPATATFPLEGGGLWAPGLPPLPAELRAPP